MTESTGRDGEAKARAVFREVNELIATLGKSFDIDGRGSFVCECGNEHCVDPVELTSAEYEAVRSDARRFVVAIDHENPETETVVERNGDFAIVQTLVRATSGIDDETDPRAASAT